MRAVADSTLVIHFRKAEKTKEGRIRVKRWLAGQRLALITTPVTLAEFLAGENQQDTALEWFFSRFPRPVALTHTTAVRSGRIQLRRKGKKLATGDVFQAAVAEMFKAQILTFDRDYSGIPGLKVTQYPRYDRTKPQT